MREELRKLVGRFILFSATLGLLVPLTGCFTVAKMVYQEAKGAQGKVHPRETVSPSIFADINSLEFEPAATDLGERLAPPKLLTDFDAAAAKMVKDKDYATLFPGGEPKLRVETTLYYFQSKGAFSGAEALGRVRMYNGDKLVLEGIVRSESEAFTGGGESALSAALVKGIIKYVAEAKDPEKAKQIEEKRSKGEGAASGDKKTSEAAPAEETKPAEEKKTE